jgi:hypothetical protein
VWTLPVPATATQFQNGNAGMSIYQRWQFAAVSEHVEFGVVPFPWGSNVQWPESGNWQDLSEEGYTSWILDANIFAVIQGSPEGLTHEIAAGIAHSYRAGQSQSNNAVNAILAHRAGEPNPVPPPNILNLFEPEDMEIWEWYANQAVMEATVRMGMPSGFFQAIVAAIGTNTDVRPALQGMLGQDIFTMLDLGRISADDVPAELLLLAEEYNVALIEQNRINAINRARNEAVNAYSRAIELLEAWAEVAGFEIEYAECGRPIFPE